jgi:antitoxin YefM
MVRRVSAAQAKAHLSELVSRVAHGGERVVIERRGTPMAALVKVEDLARLEAEKSLVAEPLGALALVGAWADLGDDEMDALVDHVYAERARDLGRPVDFGP